MLIRHTSWIVFFLLVYLLFIIIKFFFYHSCLFDTIFKLDFNESIANLYSFTWTNFWFLPVFFFSLLLLFLSFFCNKLFVPFIFIFIFYFYEVTDFFASNEFIIFFKSSFISINFFLTNSLNKYHPLIFYCSVILAFVFLFYFIVWFFNYKKFAIEFFFNKDFSLLIFLISFFALYLGSWWALQEGTWGGWWNWDASEVFGLLVLLFALYLTHLKFNCKFFFSFFSFSVFFLNFFILIYCLIQLNFDLISHNFGIKFFFFFNNTFFLCEFFFICSTYIHIKIFTYIFFHTNFFFLSQIKLIKNQTFYFVKFVLSVSLLSIIFYSFNSIFNFFLWNFFSFNLSFFLDTHYNCQLIVCFILIFLWQFSKKINFITTLGLLWTMFNFNFFAALFTFILFRFRFVFLIHWFFLNFLFVNLFTFNTQLSVYLFKSLCSSSLVYDILSTSHLHYYGVDAYCLDFISCQYFYANFWNFNFNFLFLPVYLLTSKFLFGYFNSLLTNLLVTENGFFLSVTFIEIIYLEYLNFWIFFFMIYYFYFLFAKVFYLFK